FFFSSRRRHTRSKRDWSSDVCSSDLDIYSREGLDYRQRAISTISALVTLGTEPQLELHINVALTVGLTPQEISETIMHLLPYVGFPKVLNALKIVKRVYKERGVSYSSK